MRQQNDDKPIAAATLHLILERRDTSDWNHDSQTVPPFPLIACAGVALSRAMPANSADRRRERREGIGRKGVAGEDGVRSAMERMSWLRKDVHTISNGRESLASSNGKKMKNHRQLGFLLGLI